MGGGGGGGGDTTGGGGGGGTGAGSVQAISRVRAITPIMIAPRMYLRYLRFI